MMMRKKIKMMMEEMINGDEAPCWRGGSGRRK